MRPKSARNDLPFPPSSFLPLGSSATLSLSLVIRPKGTNAGQSDNRYIRLGNDRTRRDQEIQKMHLAKHDQ